MAGAGKIQSGYLERKLQLGLVVQQRVEVLLAQNRPRLRGVEACVERFGAALGRLEREPSTDSLSTVNELHNELCMVDALLHLNDPSFTLIEYEPRLPVGKRRIDFCARRDDVTYFVEVKTIQPDLVDRWDQYQRIVDAGHITDNVTIHFEQRWMGGELWHQKFSSRSKMLDYSIDFEDRIRESAVDMSQASFILALFSDGFAWHEDELEDFVSFYRTGRHRADDGLAKMEEYVLRDRTLTRQISAFAYLCRPAFEAAPTVINWNVEAPPEPWCLM